MIEDVARFGSRGIKERYPGDKYEISINPSHGEFFVMRVFDSVPEATDDSSIGGLTQSSIGVSVVVATTTPREST